MDFYPNPFEVGNLSTIGMLENEAEDRVNRMINDIRNNYGYYIPARIVDEKIEEYEIPYVALPQWLKDKIDDAFEVH